MNKRPVEVAVISDLHLGTYASRAKEFAAYLKSIEPRLLVLNGDIIDGWQFSKRYFPRPIYWQLKRFLASFPMAPVWCISPAITMMPFVNTPTWNWAIFCWLIKWLLK
ncbi:metallophosphoesterase [Niabella hibiscisoli]|uniref:metallophosphoesterase n=1 Tax=Niabella hibiscisoli TaxID=1825928 RepID=UPI00374CCE6E